jgi:hypothetical protein
MPTDANMTGSVMTPTAQVVALYAEYDSLLDALEAVQLQLQLQLRVKRCRDRRVYNALRVQVREICEALADVHEKIAEFVILPRGGNI